MVQTPIPQAQSLRTPINATVGSVLSPTSDPLAGSGVAGDQLELVGTILPGTASTFGFEVRKAPGQETIIGYSVAGRYMYINRDRSGSFDTFTGTTSAPLTLMPDGTIKFDIFVDESSVEVFGNNGLATMTDLIFPDPSATGVSMFATGGTAQLLSFQAYQISLVPEPASLAGMIMAGALLLRRHPRQARIA
jgi:levanase